MHFVSFNLTDLDVFVDVCGVMSLFLLKLNLSIIDLRLNKFAFRHKSLTKVQF